VFLSGAVINPADLYHSLCVPTCAYLQSSTSVTFLGLNMAAKGSIILAILAGLSQFVQMHLSPAMQNTSNTSADDVDTQTKMMTSMTSSMKYTMPFMIAFSDMRFRVRLRSYWIISNLFMIAQERFVMMRIK
jgi:membrane protein insertase Oxa1/YidC/SpoIIIJ